MTLTRKLCAVGPAVAADPKLRLRSTHSDPRTYVVVVVTVGSIPKRVEPSGLRVMTAADPFLWSTVIFNHVMSAPYRTARCKMGDIECGRAYRVWRRDGSAWASQGTLRSRLADGWGWGLKRPQGWGWGWGCGAGRFTDGGAPLLVRGDGAGGWPRRYRTVRVESSRAVRRVQHPAGPLADRLAPPRRAQQATRACCRSSRPSPPHAARLS